MRNRISIRGFVLPLAVVAAALATALGVTSVVLEPTASTAQEQGSATPIRDVPPEGSVTRSTTAPGQRLAAVKAKHRAARLAREARAHRLARAAMAHRAARAHRLAREARAARSRAARSHQRSPSFAGDPRSAARRMAAARYGWGDAQFGCLRSLWARESGWNHRAANPSSGAYGIPQALPGSKMASKGADWRTNPVTQISWGLSYVKAVYGTPCSAWSHSQSSGWY